MRFDIPATQRAVQLTGPDELRLNDEKPVVPPGPHQVLCRVDAVGLCFSDLKLLKQFSRHPRKGEVVSGISSEILREVSSYVPNDLPTVPGHEAVVTIWAVGPSVTRFKPGERYLVQTDYRWLRTDGSNAAFGYNLEGALQEYVLMDERVITSPEGESMLIPAGEHLSDSAVALVEPWACVEDAYVSKERQVIRQDGRMLVVCDEDVPGGALARLFSLYGAPTEVAWLSSGPSPAPSGVAVRRAASLSDIEDGAYSDIVYFGADPETIESLFPKLTTRGLLSIALCGKRISRAVSVAVGRVHYGGIRIVGTAGSDPAESMAIIPASGEVRAGDTIDVIGAGGPMGVMHVVRDICLGLDGVTVRAGDLDADRLSALDHIASPLAARHGASFATYDPRHNGGEQPSYTVVMVPSPALVAGAIARSGPRGIVNVFAGIPADVNAEVDLNAYIEKGLYLIGTSGSVLEDMKAVLRKVETGALDTNLSLAAVSGLEGAIQGIRAIENRQVHGKIIVYPACRSLGLITLEEIEASMPEVASHLDHGLWTRGSEKALLAAGGREPRV